MRRKLIKQDAFDKIVSESITNAEKELVEAEPILARKLGKNCLNLESFNESVVLYRDKNSDSFVHAGYQIKNGHITFNNIEELVIDEASQKEKRREFLSEMIDAVLVDNSAKADDMFSNYLNMVRWTEAKHEGKKGGFPFHKKGEKHDDDDHKHSDEKKNHLFFKAKKAGKDLAEAYVTSQNVLDYVEFMKIGPALAEAVEKTDERGNVTDLRIPSKKLRIESKLQRFDWKTLNARVADSRKKIPYFAESQDFCKAIAHLKRQNGFSDLEGLNKALNHVVTQWPEVIYATQGELAQIVGEALSNAGIRDFEDKTCEFLAEGILRRAQSLLSDRVTQVLHLASAPKMEENMDPYAYFQAVVENFYPSLDEKFGLERQVFVDLYDSLRAVYGKAERQGDNALKSEAAAYLNELADILNEKIRPDLELAEETAEFLANVIETNLEMGKWVVSNTPHLTVTGDHPDMAKKAGTGYTPSKDFSGNWGDEAPAIGQDTMNYKSGKNARQMRNDSWGQEGGNEVFPKLRNPYVPKPFGDYTMKPAKGVDKDNTNFGMFSTSDTWPGLENPYVPKEAGGPGGKGYRMKNGKETDLVVDR